jgi:Cupin
MARNEPRSESAVPITPCNQSGGWARKVTQADFPISTAVSGVNMRLGPSGIRELHWHQSAEWAYMTNGQCRITVLDKDGRAHVQDVSEGDLWFLPSRPAAFAAGDRTARLRIPHRVRRRQGIRIQHAAGDRLARTHSRTADAHAAGGELGDQAGRER